MTILTVSQLTQAIKGQLEQRFPHVQIKGEISNLKIQASGHLYFTLKDAASQISSVLFRGNAKNLARTPKDGDEVVCTGEVSVYAPRGSYQLIVRKVEYSGIGDLLVKFQALKEKLTREGLFDSTHKKPLPPFPKTIGVITSPTGAVIRDIIHVLRRRAPGFQLILNPVKVQGEGASIEIAKAVEDFNALGCVDLLIIGRGGGSLEDLWPFNEEIVTRAVFNSRIPIISAVGHETDVSLCDFAADVRAPTPSAAAEIAMGEKARLIENLALMRENLITHLQQNVNYHRLRMLAITRQPMLCDPYALIGQLLQKMDEIGPSIARGLKTQVLTRRIHISGLQKQMQVINPAQKLAEKKENLKRLVAHLKAIDPKNLLQKGYSIVFSQKDNSVIMSAKSLTQKDQVRMQFADGSVDAEVVSGKENHL